MSKEHTAALAPERDEVTERASEGIGDALRVLEQVVSDLHLAKLGDLCRKMERHFTMIGVPEHSLLAADMHDLAVGSLRAGRALARKELDVLMDGYVVITETLDALESGAALPRPDGARGRVRRAKGRVK